MIEIKNVTKRFGEYEAVSHMNLSIGNGIVYGLLGTNGAGKSTLLRMIAGVIQPDEGVVLLDNVNVYDNPEAKSKMFYISDDQYFFAHSSGAEMVKYYSAVYENFDMEQFEQLTETLSLDKKRKIDTFSKGMKKQMSIVLGVCAKTEYLLCDETFDGLDPVMRQAIKSLFAKEMSERTFTPIIASHNLREIEDICDNIGLLHKGGVILSKELDEVKVGMHKIQCVFKNEGEYEKFTQACKVVSTKQTGSMYTITVNGSREEVEAKLASVDTIFCETLPLTLEEIFICETEGVGYDIKKLIIED